MKFLTKINRNYIVLLTFILLIISTSAYFIMREIMFDNAKENLFEKEALIKSQIKRTGELPNIYPIIETKKLLHETTQLPVYNEVNIRNINENETEIFLEYSNQIKIRNNFYSIKLRQSTFENEDLVFILTSLLSVLLLSVFIISFFITKKLNKTVWKNFEKNLQEIEQFSFTANKPLQLIQSDIEEFDRLNKVVNNLTEKLESDYLSLKEFSENASHEIQTPLSIALLNLDELLQQDISEEAFKKIFATIQALNRLSTLNQSLILLTKIENRQFVADKIISFNDLIVRKIEEFSTLFETKKINVEFNKVDDFSIKINEQLAEILINNMLSNAIKHNIENGQIQIITKINEIKICNSGEANALTDDTIFNRFTKGNSNSFGLGLAIAKNICETNQLEIHYIKNKLHCFSITRKI